MRPSSDGSARDMYLAGAAAALVVASLLGVAATLQTHLSMLAELPGDSVVDAPYYAQLWTAVARDIVFALGFAVLGVALFAAGSLRPTRLKSGALILAGGYAVALAVPVIGLSRFYSDPARDLPIFVQAQMVTQAAAYLPAVVAGLLIAVAFSAPRTAALGIRGRRNTLLGWAATAFGIMYALRLLSVLLAAHPFLHTVSLRDLAHLAALAATVVATVAFFRAARGASRSAGDPAPSRDRLLGVAAVLFLTYRVMELAQSGNHPSWLWSLALVPLAAAPLLSALGFLASSRPVSTSADGQGEAQAG